MSVNLELDTSKFDGVALVMVEELPLVPARILDEGSAIFEQFLIEETPKRTGNLAASIERQIGDDFAYIQTTAGYGLFVNLDTQPHIIEPVNANVLAFEIDGRTVFAKRVQHPGTKGQNFVRKAIEAGKSMFRDTVKGIIDDLRQRGIGA